MMRIAGLFLIAVLVACSSNGSSKTRTTDPQVGPPMDPLPGTTDPGPTDPGPADPGPADPGPADPTPATGPAAAGAERELGTAAMIASNKRYPVHGTKLSIEQLGASMAMASDGEGNDFEYVTADIVLTLGGAEYRVAMAGGQPTEWKGFRVTIDELGFNYDTDAVSVLVERVAQ